MDALAVSAIQLSPVKHFDQIVDIRAVKREHLRGRNNVTSCRSPTREIDTRLIKDELKEKRHLEFLRRRSVSPELCDNASSRRKPSPKTFLRKHHSSISKPEILNTTVQMNPTNGRPVISDGPSTSSWASLWSDQVTLTKQERAKKQASTSTIKESNLHTMKSTDKREDSIHGQNTSIKTFIQPQKIHKEVVQTEDFLQKQLLQNTSMQTESGLVIVQESDLLNLTDYLQEALWREEAVKKKLAVLQESTANLMNSTNKIWTAHCSEDLLRNKIKALEAQLQVCLQKLPKDGVRRLAVQMEKQKLVYEERALVALQRATQEKTEALSKAETMQEALNTAKAEACRWQNLCEELKISSAQLREKQHLSNEQLQQLHSQVELSRTREDELMEELVSLRQETKELQHNIFLLEENSHILRENIQHIQDGQDLMMKEGRLISEEEEPRLTVRRDSEVEEQLRHMQEKLRLKEEECMELHTELHTIEQQCQSSQAQLSQCRDQLRQPSRRPEQCGSWWKMCVYFLILLTMAAVAMLWLWHPPFREQVEELYSDIETRIENYLMEMASPQHSGCFRPV